MAASQILGYKKIFGLVLPEWVNEKLIRNFVLGVLGVAVMFLLLIFVIWPNFGAIRTRESELERSKDSLETLQNSKTGMERLRSDLTSDQQQRILAAIPQAYSPESAIYMLRRISADTGVSIISYSLPSGILLDIGETTGQAANGQMVSFTSFPIRLTVAAPVDSLLKFIATVESSLPYGVVADLNLQEVTRLAQTAVNDKTVQLALEIRFFQANLNRVNLSQLIALTAEDIELAKELGEYNLLTIPETGLTETSAPVATASGGVFGF